MMAHDPEGKMGPKMQLPDNVIVHEPKAGTATQSFLGGRSRAVMVDRGLVQFALLFKFEY